MSNTLSTNLNGSTSSASEGVIHLSGDRQDRPALRSSMPCPEPEVSAPKSRRIFTAKYKLNILDELDRCTKVGERGAVIRREGLYASQITQWRQQRHTGALTALNKLRGRKKLYDDKDRKISQLEQENSKLKKTLVQAEAIIEVQKKVCEIFGVNTQKNEKSEEKSC